MIWKISLDFVSWDFSNHPLVKGFFESYLFESYLLSSGALYTKINPTCPNRELPLSILSLHTWLPNLPTQCWSQWWSLSLLLTWCLRPPKAFLCIWNFWQKSYKNLRNETMDLALSHGGQGLIEAALPTWNTHQVKKSSHIFLRLGWPKITQFAKNATKKLNSLRIA